MTKQEIYDKVKAHLLAQGIRSNLRSSGMCAYRGEGGLKCAAGALVDDEHYDSWFEGGIVSRLVPKSSAVCDALVKSGVDEKDLPFVAELQLIHDTEDPSDWRESLEELARKEGLNP